MPGIRAQYVNGRWVALCRVVEQWTPHIQGNGAAPTPAGDNVIV